MMKTYGWMEDQGKFKKSNIWHYAAKQWNAWKDAMDTGATTAVASTELRAAIDKIYDLWNWDTMVTQMNQPDYLWGNVHGDFHFGQLMRKEDEESGEIDLILLDWEFSGYAATPGIDLAYFAMTVVPWNLATYQD